MATEIIGDRTMHLQRIPKIFRNTYWISCLCNQRIREQPLHNDDITIIDNRIELYLLMLKMGKVGHREQLPNYVQIANAGLMGSMQKQGLGRGFDHVEYYKIKGSGTRSFWITITSPYTDKYTEELKKDGFVPVKPIYALHASSYIRVQILTKPQKVSLMSQSDLSETAIKLIFQ